MRPDARRRPLSSAGAVSNNQSESHETLTGIVVRGWC